MSSTKISVSISLGHENIRVGILWFHIRKGRESASFEYDKAWLNHPEKFALEPALQLTEGEFHTNPNTVIFGAIGDSAPDRWGRVLMRRAEARNTEGIPKTLFEMDYLLGVNDEARQGAMRFSFSEEPNIYLAPQKKTTIPPLIALPNLSSAIERFIEDDETSEDLRLLLAPGSSLGGARPKATVRDQKGFLAIAKFSRKDDDYNVVVWEAVALTLAKQAGIQVPEWRLENILGKPVLIIHRFDRKAEQRIPFLSAMSMLGAKDNEQHSYLEIAYALAQRGASPTEDMHALWRRIVFNIMIANTDDHLRNHGFLYERQRGWRLSPAYDMNPTPLEIKPRILTTAIDFDNTAADIDVAKSVAKDFRLSKKQADDIINEVSTAVQTWKKIAIDYGLSAQECNRMASAFKF
ncbi:MAG: type II toxin-antitoxin system HipA family toxin [Alphaproteobacteria bacterium]|nr:type II toxin-antitoxin system HipA family toxin [Alphaproteobacteria bacterium]